MHLEDFDFDLPESLIASFPLEKRDDSRLLHYSRATGALEHRRFAEISEILKEGDILVRNNSKVLALRFYIYDGQNLSAEILLTENLSSTNFSRTFWKALVKPGKKIKESKKIFYIANQIPITLWREGDNFFVEFNSSDDFEIAVRDFGLMPLPPYMKRDATILDKERYQTIYAQDHNQGASIAAPTAGLHFTDEVNKKLQAKGITILDTCLHVGLGTFMPIRTDEIENHDMHEEYFEITQETWQTILQAKKQKRRIIAVGSTSTRVLETVASNKINNLDDQFFDVLKEPVKNVTSSIVRTEAKAELASRSGSLGLLTDAFPEDQMINSNFQGVLKGKTKIFIYPGYDFKIIDGLITNFHLPKSTLMLMISAFLGTEKVKEIYQEAIIEKYRFYSYGDCCFFE